MARKRANTLRTVAVATLVLLTAAMSVRAELIATWQFDPADVSGSNVSASAGTGANATGTLIDNASATGGALDLDGNGDYLQFGSNVADLRNLPAMTLAAWVNTDSTVDGDRRRIVEHEDNFYFWADGVDGPSAFQYTTHGTPGGYPDARAVSSTAPQVGTWQHVLAIYHGGGVPADIYIDGVLEGTSASDQNTMPDNAQTLQIGARRSSSGSAEWFWDGQLDDVAIWDNILTQREIDMLSGRNSGGYPARITPTSIPEPTAVALLGSALAVMLLTRRRRG